MKKPDIFSFRLPVIRQTNGTLNLFVHMTSPFRLFRRRSRGGSGRRSRRGRAELCGVSRFRQCRLRSLCDSLLEQIEQGLRPVRSWTGGVPRWRGADPHHRRRANYPTSALGAAGVWWRRASTTRRHGRGGDDDPPPMVTPAALIAGGGRGGDEDEGGQDGEDGSGEHGCSPWVPQNNSGKVHLRASRRVCFRIVSTGIFHLRFFSGK